MSPNNRASIIEEIKELVGKFGLKIDRLMLTIGTDISGNSLVYFVEDKSETIIEFTSEYVSNTAKDLVLAEIKAACVAWKLGNKELTILDIERVKCGRE